MFTCSSLIHFMAAHNVNKMHVSSERLLADSLPSCKLVFPNLENEITWHLYCVRGYLLDVKPQSCGIARWHPATHQITLLYSRESYFKTFQLFSQFQSLRRLKTCGSKSLLTENKTCFTFLRETFWWDNKWNFTSFILLSLCICVSDSF